MSIINECNAFMTYPKFITLTQTLIVKLPMGAGIWTIIHSISANFKVRSISLGQVHLSNSHKQELTTSECFELNLYELWYLEIIKLHMWALHICLLDVFLKCVDRT